jgi:hypothetical protein
MGQDWFSGCLEFVDCTHTTIYRLSKSNAQSPIVLSHAPLSEPQAVFQEIEDIGSSFAIPTLTLLALDAADGGDGVEKTRLYDIAFTGKPFNTPSRKFLKTDRQEGNRVEQQIERLRERIGQKTIGTIRWGYELRVPVKRLASFALTSQDALLIGTSFEEIENFKTRFKDATLSNYFSLLSEGQEFITRDCAQDGKRRDSFRAALVRLMSAQTDREMFQLFDWPTEQIVEAQQRAEVFLGYIKKRVAQIGSSSAANALKDRDGSDICRSNANPVLAAGIDVMRIVISENMPMYRFDFGDNEYMGERVYFWSAMDSNRRSLQTWLNVYDHISTLLDEDIRLLVDLAIVGFSSAQSRLQQWQGNEMYKGKTYRELNVGMMAAFQQLFEAIRTAIAEQAARYAL